MSTLELEHLKHTSSSSNNLSVHSDGSIAPVTMKGSTATLNIDSTSGNANALFKLNGATTASIEVGGGNSLYLTANNAAGNIYLRNGSSAQTNMTVSTAGHITQPYQPICSLQPDTNSDVTTASSSDHIVGWKTVGGRQTLLRSGLTLGASSGTTIANGGSTGRITFTTGGVYYFDCTIRMENTPGAGNLKLRHNGNTIHRMHVETWGRYNYAHAWISRCVTASANDYVEFVVAVPSGRFSGSNDTVNWLTIIKVA